jgi:hypothetical protein
VGTPNDIPMPVPEKLEPIVEHRLKRENADLRAQIRESLGKQVHEQGYQQFIAEVAAARRPAPAWTLKAKSGKRHQAMPVAHLSDIHHGECVNPGEVGGVNGFDSAISKRRTRRFFEKTILLCDEYLAGVDYPGIVCPVSGDIVTGNIHDELRETNDKRILPACLEAAEMITSGLKMFAERFGSVYAPWVVGNHGRLDKKPRAKGAVEDNYDWLIGALVMTSVKDDKRITVDLAPALDHQFEVYGVRYLQTHGNQFKGGSGIAAELSPMFIGDARKRKKHASIKQPYDVMILGHWHRRICLPNVKCNGTIKGFDEYSLFANFEFQAPQQSFWLTTPEHGITMEAPILVKCSNEGWEKSCR